MSSLLPRPSDATVAFERHPSVSVVELPQTSEAAAGDGGCAAEDGLLDRFGPVLGVGDLLWRAVARASADVVCVVDRRHLGLASVPRLVGPLFDDPELLLVNGAYDPPDLTDPRDGDRLTELVARPLIRQWEPTLAGLRQPLFYEFAARTSLLRELSFPVGSGIHMSLPIDVVRAHGRAAIEEVRIGRSRVDGRPLRALGADACSVISAMRRRVGSDDGATVERFVRPWDDLSAIYVETAERPPLAGVDGDGGRGRRSECDPALYTGRAGSWPSSP